MVAFLSSVLAPRPLCPECPDIRNPIGVDALEHGLGGAIFPVGALHGELLAVVDHTVQPAQASLWLRNHGT